MEKAEDLNGKTEGVDIIEECQMTDPNANKPRYLKITSCGDCAECGYGTRYVCDKLWVIHPDNSRIHKYNISKTFHPDCPLPKLDAMIQPIVDVWEEACQWKAKHGGSAENTNPVETITLFKKTLIAIKETIKLNEGRVK